MTLRTWLAESLSGLASALRGAEAPIPPPRAQISLRGPGYEMEEAEEYSPYHGGSSGTTTDPLKVDEPLNGWDAFFQLWISNPTVSACVQLISQAMMYNGWKVVPAKGKDGKAITGANEADGAALHDFLANCHPYLTFDQILGQMLPGLCLAYRQFGEIAYNKLRNERTAYGRTPGGLYPISAQGKIVARLKENGLFDTPAWMQQREGGGKGAASKKPIPFDWEQILWLQLSNIVQRGIFSVSPVEMLRVPLGTNIAAGQYIHSFFTTGGKIGLVFTVPATAGAQGKQIAQAFAEDFKRKFTSTKKGFQVIALHSGLTVESSPAMDKHGIEFIDIMKFHDHEICGVFGPTPRLIGRPDGGGTLGGKGEREQAWYECISNVVLPKVRFVNAALKKQIVDQGLGFTDWAIELQPAKTNPSEESREILSRIQKAAAELGTVDTKSVEDVNMLRAEIYPDAAPYVELPGASRSTREIYQYDLLVGDITENEHRAGKGLPPIAGGDARVKLELSPQGGVQAPEQRGAPQPRAIRLGKAAARVPKGEARAILADFESSFTEELQSGMSAILERVKTRLSKVFADKDAKALKDFNFAPGGTAFSNAGKARAKALYAKAYAATEREVKALAKAAKAQKRNDPHVTARGDINDYIDLVSTAYFDDLFADVASEARDTYLEGARAGWTVNEFTAALTSRFEDIDENDIRTNVRTIGTEFFNLARERMFRDSDGLVETVEYTAIDDDALCEICKPFYGTVFRSLDDPNLAAATPPNHWGCRCLLAPVMQGEDYEVTDPSEVRSAMKNIQTGFGAAERSERSARRYFLFCRQPAANAHAA